MDVPEVTPLAHLTNCAGYWCSQLVKLVAWLQVDDGCMHHSCPLH